MAPGLGVSTPDPRPGGGSPGASQTGGAEGWDITGLRGEGVEAAAPPKPCQDRPRSGSSREGALATTDLTIAADATTRTPAARLPPPSPPPFLLLPLPLPLGTGMALTRWAVAGLSAPGPRAAPATLSSPSLLCSLFCRRGLRARAQDLPEGTGAGSAGACALPGERAPADLPLRPGGAPPPRPLGGGRTCWASPVLVPAPGPAWGLARSKFSAARPAPGQPLTTPNCRFYPDVASADLRPHAAWRLAQAGRDSAAVLQALSPARR